MEYRYDDKILACVEKDSRFLVAISRRRLLRMIESPQAARE
jgi:hypothetical protein